MADFYSTANDFYTATKGIADNPFAFGSSFYGDVPSPASVGASVDGYDEVSNRVTLLVATHDMFDRTAVITLTPNAFIGSVAVTATPVGAGAKPEVWQNGLVFLEVLDGAVVTSIAPGGVLNGYWRDNYNLVITYNPRNA